MTDEVTKSEEPENYVIPINSGNARDLLGVAMYDVGVNGEISPPGSRLVIGKYKNIHEINSGEERITVFYLGDPSPSEGTEIFLKTVREATKLAKYLRLNKMEFREKPSAKEAVKIVRERTSDLEEAANELERTTL